MHTNTCVILMQPSRVDRSTPQLMTLMFQCNTSGVKPNQTNPTPTPT